MLKDKKFLILTVLVLLLAGLIRLRGFTTHFLLASDTARDLLVAAGAIELGKIPLVGSFSSAGPFVFGPNWYWFLMAIESFTQKNFIAPWIIMFIISLIFIWVLIQVGKVVGGKKLGLLTGLIAAIFPGIVGYSTYLTQHGLVEIFSALSLLGFVLLLKTKKLIFSILLAFSIGAAISLHYQALNLLVYFPVVVIACFLSTKSIPLCLKLVLVLCVSVALPLLPLMLWDAGRNFQNLQSIIFFFQEGQYRFPLTMSWRIYLSSFWPNFLSNFSGTQWAIGLLLFLGIFAAGPIELLKRKRNSQFILCFLVFLIQFVAFRYYRGQAFDGYLVYLHGIMVLMLSWLAFSLVKLNKLFGLALLIVLVIAIASSVRLMSWDNNYDQMTRLVSALKSKYPDEKFSLYGKMVRENIDTLNCGYSLSYALDAHKLSDNTGRPLAICKYTLETCRDSAIEFIGQMDFQNDACFLGSIPQSENNLTRENEWFPFTKEEVYKDVQGWWQK